MATIRARFVLEDHASGTMGKIAAKAEVLDRALHGLDQRLEQVDNRTDDWSTNFERRTKRMSENVKADVMGMRASFSALNLHLNTMDRKKTMTVTADTSRAKAEIAALQSLAGRNVAMGIGATGGGGAFFGGAGGGLMGRRGGGGGAGIISSMLNGLDNTLGKVRISLGFFSATLGALPAALAAVGPPAMAVASALGTILGGALAATTALGIGAISMFGALAFGIGAIAIPAVMAGKALGEKNKEIDKTKKALDKANRSLNRATKYTADGTKVTSSYRNAMRRVTDAQNAYNAALGKVSKSERALLGNVDKLKKAWNDQVMGGKSGARAVSMMNEGVMFATKQMPFVASMMDKFTLRGQRLFNMANRNAPRFRRQMMMATDEWPARFEEMGKSAGHFSAGLMGVLRAAEPFTKWMSQSLLANMEQFDKWANSSEGQLALRDFFNDMKPIAEALGDAIWNFGEAIIKVGQQDKGDIVYFLDEISELIKKLPDEIDYWTDKFRGAWPAIKKGGEETLDFFKNIAEAIGDIKDGALWIGDHMPASIKKGFGALGKMDIPDGVEHWAALLGTIAAYASFKKVKGGGGRPGAKVGKKGLGGGLGTIAAGVVPVFVTNPGFGGSLDTAGKVGAGALGGRLAAGAVTVAGSTVAVTAATLVVSAAVGAAIGYGLSKWLDHRDAQKEARLERLEALFDDDITTGNTVWPNAQAHPSTGNGGQSESQQERFARERREKAAAAANKADAASITNAPGSAANFHALMGSIKIPEDQKPLIDLMLGAGKMDNVEFGKYIKTDEAYAKLQAIDKAVKDAMRNGKTSMTVGAYNMVLAYNDGIFAIESRKIDLSIFFADMHAKFSAGVSALGGIVQSVTGPLESFWDTLTGGGAAAPAAAATPPASGGVRARSARVAPNSQSVANPREGDSILGSGIDAVQGAVGGFISDPMGTVGGLVDRVRGWLANKGTAGKKTSDGLGTMQSALNERMASMFSSGGAVSSTGLVPAAANLMSMLSQMFGVQLTSGFRPGSITESGNLSLHALGRALDVGGTAAQMQAVWNYMLGKGGVDELIYNGMISNNGGSPVPYGGADKHTDHVHIGLGDSRRGSGIPAGGQTSKGGIPAGGITLSLAGAEIHIHNEADYEAFVARLAEDLERAVNSSGESAGGMLDA